MDNDDFTFGSLFAGIGSFDLGLERAGMTCKWQVEIDPFCLKVLEKHWPDARRFEDVRNCGSHNLETVDLVCGGFPCQPHSVAGKRRGKDDDRNLWPEFLRIVEEIRPAWVLAENVPGIVSLYLDTVLADLEGENYICWTFNIPACAFNASHRRERIFIVAHTQSVRLQGGCERLRRVCGKGDDLYVSASGNKIEDAGSEWVYEPDVGRVADGVPDRVHRLKSLGNAVVPQVAEWIGRQILETHFSAGTGRT